MKSLSQFPIPINKVVHVKHGFDVSDITQEAYEMVMGINPSFFDFELGTQETFLPVNNVTWLDAVSFCKALTILSEYAGTLPEKFEFRLPSEWNGNMLVEQVH